MDEPHENRDFADDARRRTRLRRDGRGLVRARRRPACRVAFAARLRLRPGRREFVPCRGAGGPASSGGTWS